MKQDKEKTKTIFRIWPDGDVIALFPQIAGNMDIDTCQSYEHIGQHGAASIKSIIKMTKSAIPNKQNWKEYKELLTELRGIGYNVQIARRCTKWDREIRWQQIN